MEWQRYYQETEIVPFNYQAPSYAYLLEVFLPFITEGKEPGSPISVALGGLHPKVTTPDHFVSFCQKVFHSPLDVYIIDQNKQVLDLFPQVEGQSLVHAQLENLPAEIPPLSLLICDFTLDFMSDRQIKTLNETLPSKLDKNGLFIVTQDVPAIPKLSQLQTKFIYGVNIYPRRVKQLWKLLSNFKPIFQGFTGNYSDITVFTHKDSLIARHIGDHYSLDADNTNFTEWLKTWY